MYDEIAFHLAEHRHGLVATWELHARGVDRHHVEQLLTSRHWERIGASVLRRRGAPSTDDQQLAAAVLDSGPAAFVAHLTGGRLLGINGCPLRPIEIVGETASRRKRLGVGFHRVRSVPLRWTTEVRGIPVVAPELCAMQLFASVRYERAERWVDTLWSLGRLSGRSISVFLSEMGRPGRNGVAGLRRYFDARGVGYVPPDSGMEGRTIQVLREAGIIVRRQVDVGCTEAWTGRVDLVVVGVPVVVEVQSNAYHASLVNRERDRLRRAALEAAGFEWVELWEDDVWGRPWRLAPQVQTAIDRARARRAPTL